MNDTPTPHASSGSHAGPFADPDAAVSVGEEAPLQASHVGTLLCATRMRLGKDLQEIAAVLHIRYNFLVAIEDGRYEDLPGQAYAIGFVRAYADHLGLDGDEVVRRYKEETAGIKRVVRYEYPRPAPESGIPSGALLSIAVVLGMVVYGVWYSMADADRRAADVIQEVPERLAALLKDDGIAEPEGGSDTANVTADETTEVASADTGDETVPTPEGDDLSNAEPAPATVAADQLTLPEQKPTPVPEPVQVASAPSAADPVVMTPAKSVSSPPQIEKPATETKPAPSSLVQTQPPKPAVTQTAAEKPETQKLEAAKPEVQKPEVQKPTVNPPQKTPEPSMPAAVASKPAEDIKIASAAPPAAAPVKPAASTPVAPTPSAKTTTETKPTQTAQAPSSSSTMPATTPPTKPPPTTAEQTSKPVPQSPASDKPAAAKPAEMKVETPVTSPAPPKAPVSTAKNQVAAAGKNAIELRAKSDSWIQVRDGEQLLLTRFLRKGEVYKVPDRQGLTLMTLNAGGIDVLVDGDVMPSLGEPGTVARGVVLDAQKLRAQAKPASLPKEPPVNN